MSRQPRSRPGAPDQWRPVPDTNELYWVNPQGAVWSHPRMVGAQGGKRRLVGSRTLRPLWNAKRGQCRYRLSLGDGRYKDVWRDKLVQRVFGHDPLPLASADELRTIHESWKV